MPPCFWASETACSARVVFPDDSGPKISITLPLGSPPIPSALSRAREPVDITGTSTIGLPPSFIIDPLPNCRSICTIAVSTAFSLSGDMLMISSLSMIICLPREIHAVTAQRISLGSFVIRHFSLNPEPQSNNQ